MGQRLACGVRALAAIALALLCGCTGGGGPPASSFETLDFNGLVIPHEGGAEGLPVLLGTQSATTESDGSFNFNDVRTGTYYLAAGGFEKTIAYDTIQVSPTDADVTIHVPGSSDEFRIVRTQPWLNDEDAWLDGNMTLQAFEGIDPSTVSTGDFVFSPTIGDFQVTVDGDKIYILPRRQLAAGLQVLLSIEGQILSTSGETLKTPFRIRFKTSAADRSYPVLVDSIPADQSSGHPINSPVRFVFNENLDAHSVVTAELESETQVRVESSANMVLISPLDEWLPNTEYHLTLFNVRDEIGNTVPYTTPELTFTTGAQRAPERSFNPEWSSALNAIIFASDQLGSFDIYRVNPDGTGLVPLTTAAGDELHPTLSSDGQLLAWQARGSGGDWDILVAPLSDPGSAVAVTPSDANDTEPRFARTGSRSIVFVSDRLGTPQIFRMAADGSGYSALAPSFGSAQYSPAPHPLIDNQLLFASPREGSPDIWSMSVSAIDGSVTAINQTETLSYTESQPDWGADASYFVYLRDQDGVRNLWAGDLTGNSRRVTSFAQPLSDPSVSPLPGAARCVASLARTDGGSDLVIIDLVGGTIVANLTSPEAGN